MNQLTFERVLDEAAEADERRRRIALDRMPPVKAALRNWG